MNYTILEVLRTSGEGARRTLHYGKEVDKTDTFEEALQKVREMVAKLAIVRARDQVLLATRLTDPESKAPAGELRSMKGN